MNSDKLVSICMITYNHEKYIAQAIEGILMQNFEFQVELVIGEDNSKDNTRKICDDYAKKYPQIIRLLPTAVNLGMMPNFVRTLKECKGKYIALCEGDDYWSDPFKLQKQFDFLEANEDYGLVHTDLDQYDTVKNKWERGLWKQYGYNKISGDIYDSLMYSNPGNGMGIYLCTMFFRSKYVKENIEFEDVMAQKFMYGDVPLYLHIARHSKIGYIPESTAVRNVLSFSATQGQGFEYMISFRRTALSIFEYFNNLRPVKLDLEKVYRKHKQNELDVCFRYQKREEFNIRYRAMSKKEINYITFIQRIGISNKYCHFISRAILKVIKMLKISY